VGKKGVVRDPAVHERVVRDATQSAAEVGLARVATTESPITGDTGNREFFLHLRASDSSEAAWTGAGAGSRRDTE
jgi:23S rRNA (cytidine1920-2'-O)/16S rRNA (cytidine1409-2'-O)-methyltransferase